MGSVYVNLRTGRVEYGARHRERKPQWWTPGRGNALANIMASGRPYGEAFDLVEAIIARWKAEDRERDYDLWQLERNQIHGERGVFGRRFDPVGLDRFLEQRPSYYLVGQGMDVLRGHRPVAQVRVPSTHINLFVQVPPQPKLGKWARKKLRRRGQEVPAPDVDKMLQDTVAAWWDN